MVALSLERDFGSDSESPVPPQPGQGHSLLTPNFKTKNTSKDIPNTGIGLQQKKREQKDKKNVDGKKTVTPVQPAKPTDKCYVY